MGHFLMKSGGGYKINAKLVGLLDTGERVNVHGAAVLLCIFVF